MSLIFVSSCKSVKEISVGEVDHRLSEKELVYKVLDQQKPFKSLFFKHVQFEFDYQGQLRSLKGNLNLIQDSVIILSLTPFMGIEAFRVLLYPDRIIVIDRLDKKVLHGDYSYVDEKFHFPVDFAFLQSVLTNSLFSYPQGDTLSLLKYYGSVKSDRYSLTSSKGRHFLNYSKDNFIHTVLISPSIFRMTSSVITYPIQNVSFTVDYDNFKTFSSDYIFPSVINMKGSHLSDTAHINIFFSSLEVNSSQSISSQVPDNYENINL
ncbi:DUF4292 domain-containing protein [Geofilum sp. OHC36d9]|uniref:DUF4292 domain-containing protein n=1 Tax=Geofilum sp. OHC36d9 TaxID=3458413 RepID=UPI004034CDD8